jgi:hypothetical protein
VAGEVEWEAIMKEQLAAVHQAVLDYAEGWYLGDAERMARALHPAFVKRQQADTDDGFETVGRDDLLAFIEQGIGVDPDCEITIIVDDVSDIVASARCYSCLYLDLVHLGKFDGEWKLVHSYYRHLDPDE